MAKIFFQQKPVQTNGEPPQVGQKAPELEGTTQDLTDKHLRDFGGKKKLIYMVPSLDTSVCGASTKHFNEWSKKYPDVVFLILSCDLPFAQKRFCQQEKVENVLTLSLMRSKATAEKYGVLLLDGPLKGLCARAVFVLDAKNQILYKELVSEITHEPNYEAALKALSS